MKTPHDLMEINWLGETLQCRPIEWDREPSEMDATAVRYECTCPGCGHCVQFDTKSRIVECECGIVTTFDTPSKSKQDPEPGQEQDPEPEQEQDPEPEQDAKATEKTKPKMKKTKVKTKTKKKAKKVKTKTKKTTPAIEPVAELEAEPKMDQKTEIDNSPLQGVVIDRTAKADIVPSEDKDHLVKKHEEHSASHLLDKGQVVDDDPFSINSLMNKLKKS